MSLLRFLLINSLIYQALWGAFEGVSYFRYTFQMHSRQFPTAFQNPARLPAAHNWLSIGVVRPFGFKWGESRSVSLGIGRRAWRGGLGLLTTGDGIYRESAAVVNLSRTIHEDFVIGMNIMVSHIGIRLEGNGVAARWQQSDGGTGFGCKVNLGETMILSLWYDGWQPDPDAVYGSYHRQVFQIGLESRDDLPARMGIFLEKTPGFPLQQMAGAALQITNWIHIGLGYRSSPGVLHGSVAFAAKRGNVLVAWQHHPVLGSTPVLSFSMLRY